MAAPEISTDTTRFDDAKADAFADRFIDALNASSLMMMFSIAHRTGLFDAMDGMTWATVEQIADAADLNERYVRNCSGPLFRTTCSLQQAANVPSRKRVGPLILMQYSPKAPSD